MVSASRPPTPLHVGRSFSYTGYWVNNYIIGQIELKKESIMVILKIIFHYSSILVIIFSFPFSFSF